MSMNGVIGVWKLSGLKGGVESGGLCIAYYLFGNDMNIDIDKLLS